MHNAIRTGLTILTVLLGINVTNASGASFTAGGYLSASTQFDFVSSLQPISYRCNPNSTFGCFARASFGTVGVSAFHDPTDPFFNISTAFSIASFSDSITVTAPDRAGTRGIAQINYTLEGSIDFSKISARDAAILYSGTPAVALIGYTTNDVREGATSGRLIRFDYNRGNAYDVATFVSYDWHFTYGVPTPFSTAIDLRIGAGFADFSNTLAITSIRAIDGNRLPINATFIGDTGVDYVNLAQQNRGLPSVPESQTWIMMLAGFGTIGSALRRARQKRRLIAIGLPS